MNKYTFFRFLYRLFFFVFFIGCVKFSNAQILHSATDSAAFSFTFPADSAMGFGFRFSPTQDLFIDQMGKLVPANGDYSWVIWDAKKKSKVYQQHSMQNNPMQYSYEKIDSNIALVLKQGKEYILEMYLFDSVEVYLRIPPQVGQHITYYETRICSDCDTNTFPADIQPVIQAGLPDFLYSLLPLKRGMNDAAVLSIDPPIVCSGLNDIYAEIGNYGLNQLDSVEIHWEFNGVPQTMVKYRQLLDVLNGTNPSSAKVLLGSKNFQSGISNTIKVWVSNPNGQLDTVIYGDTMEVERVPQLSGNFTLDPSLSAGGGNYTSFSALANVLNSSGICGPVNVTVAPGTYNDFFYLGEITGSSPVNTLSIDGQDSSVVILTHDGSSRYATVTLNGADYVHIKNMTIESTNSNSGASIVFGNNTSHNIISNNELIVDTNSTQSDIINIVFSGALNGSGGALGTDSNLISNNKVKGGNYGMTIYGDITNPGKNNIILNNHISNIYSRGIYAYYQHDLEINGNKINVAQRTNSISTYGLLIYNSNNTTINRNYIRAKDFAIYYNNSNPPSSPTRKIRIANNMIIADEIGVKLSAVDSVEMFHNSISALDFYPALNIEVGSGGNLSNYDLRNNIFSSNFSYAIESNQANIFSELDYNIYNSNGSDLLLVGGIYDNLSDFQAALPQYNIYSLEGDPQFLSTTSDLHIAGILGSNAGDNSVGILEDIDGEIRPQPASSNVDIGADEYVAPSCAPLFNLEAYNPVLDSITLEWDGGLGPFLYEIVQEGSAHSTGLTAIVANDSIRVGGLSPGTVYDLYVRQICGRGDSSIWWGPLAFNTAYNIPYSENFDDFGGRNPLKGWHATFGSDSWKSDSTSFYGPLSDHTSGSGGKFMYKNTAGSFGDTLNLITPPIYIDSNRKHIEFSFWYHMYGSNMGDLNVYIDTNGTSNLITRLSGTQQVNQTDPWKFFSTYLHGYEGRYVQLRFEGIEGNGLYSTMAIDDVVLDTVPPINAGVVELISPNFPICSGTHQFSVGVKNTGSTLIDSVEVFSVLNGSLVDSSMLSTTLLPGDTAVVSVGSATLNSNSFYDIGFFTRNPNSIADPINADDTLFFNNLRTGLSGNYTIDTSLPASIDNFTSFNSAVEALRTYGVCGPVNITVSSAIYYESIVLKEIPGADASNPIVFDGLDSSTTVITHDGSAEYATITFDGADYITFKNMSIVATNTTGAATVLFANAAENNFILNCQLTISAPSTTSADISNIVFSGNISFLTTGADASYNTIANNKIRGGYYGIYVFGSSTKVNDQNRIIGNEISGIYDRGVQANYQDSLEIIGNKIDLENALGNGTGIYISFANNTLLLKNEINSKKYGIFYTNFNTYSARNRNIRISNNMIVSKDCGLNMTVVSYVDIFHNSIHVGQGGDAAVKLLVTGVHQILDYDVRNNIFNSHSGPAMETNSAIALLDLDYNIYYSKDSVLVDFDNVEYSDLTAFQAAYPSLNLNSLEGSPQFGSPTDLHIYGTLANDVGDNSVGIIEDIDGDPRPLTGSTTVDIGADEFDPPSCPPVRNPMAINPTANSIDLSWIGGSGSFEYEILQSGDTLGAGLRALTALDSLTVRGLNQKTMYDFYVREICGRNDTSIWWGPVQFITQDSINDLSLSSLQSPFLRSNSCYTSNEAVELLLINTGNVPMDFGLDTTSVNVDVVGVLNQNFAVELNDNSLNNGSPLAVGDSLLIAMGNLDMSTYGSYDFSAFVSMDLDSFPLNDTVYTNLLNQPSAGNVSVSNDTVCGSIMVELSSANSMGSIQWQRLVSGVFTDEVNADSISYDVMIDSTVTFRAVACGSQYSDTLTVVFANLPQAPTTTNDTAIVLCGDSATAILTASSLLTGADFNWYDDSSSVVPIASGDTLLYGMWTSSQNFEDTLYVSVVDPLYGCESKRSTAYAVILCTVGMNDMTSEQTNSISIFPNPSNGLFNIEGENINDELELSVFDINGKLVYPVGIKLSGNFKKQFDLSDLSNGIYFIKLEGKQSFEMRKIVIH